MGVQDEMDKMAREKELRRKKYIEIAEHKKSGNTPFARLLREKCEEAVGIILGAGVQRNQLLTRAKVKSKIFKRYSADLSIELAGWSCSSYQAHSPKLHREYSGRGRVRLSNDILFLSEDFQLFTCEHSLMLNIDSKSIDIIDVRQKNSKFLHQNLFHVGSGNYRSDYRSEVVPISNIKITSLLTSPMVSENPLGCFYISNIDDSVKSDCRSNFPGDFLNEDSDIGPWLPIGVDEVNDELNRQLDVFFAQFVKAIIVINKG